MKRSQKFMLVWVMILAILFLAACAAGNQRFELKPANFWAGLWHGLICFFTFIIGLFTDKVQMYEVNNIGNWYDFGFILGAAIFFSGGGSTCKKKRVKSADEKEWDEIGEKVEEKIRMGIKNWVEEAEDKDKDWEEIGKKIEDKIKRELKKWAEK